MSWKVLIPTIQTGPHIELKNDSRKQEEVIGVEVYARLGSVSLGQTHMYRVLWLMKKLKHLH